MKTSTSHAALGKANTALPENKSTYLHAYDIQIQAKAYSAPQKKAKLKPKTAERAEATLTFHLSGHRLVGLQPVLRVKNREENVGKNSRYPNTDIANPKSL